MRLDQHEKGQQPQTPTRRRIRLTSSEAYLGQRYSGHGARKRFFYMKSIGLITAVALLTTVVPATRLRRNEKTMSNVEEGTLEAVAQRRVRVRGERGRLEVTADKVTGLTSIPYICATLDWWPDDKCDWGVCSWRRSTMSSLDFHKDSSDVVQLVRALKALRPMILRIGGSLQDLVTYDLKREKNSAEFKQCQPFTQNKADRIGFRGGCLSLWQFDALQDLALEAETSLIFGISGLHGRERQPDITGCSKCSSQPCEPCWTGIWRPQYGARELLRHAYRRSSQNRSALAAISLGNELCGLGGIAAHLAPEALARDYVALAAELKGIWGMEDAEKRSSFKQVAFPSMIHSKTRPLLVGPDCQLPLDAIDNWNSRFLLAGADRALDALTYHLYWLGAGKEAHRMRRYLIDRQIRSQKTKYSKTDDFSAEGNLPTWPLDRAFFARVEAFERVVKPHKGKRLPLWVSESGGAYGSGAPNLTNTFASAFWYLDELGQMARHSVSLHCRQSLLGGNYALLRRNSLDELVPNPDFLATKLWARLMGSRVLDALVLNDSSEQVLDARAYAHCRLATGKNAGDLVILIINSASRRALRIDLPPALSRLRHRRLEFHVSAPASKIDDRPDIFENIVLLNGRSFTQVDDPLIPIYVPPNRPLFVDPLSYTFVIFPQAQWPACAALPSLSDGDVLRASL